MVANGYKNAPSLRLRIFRNWPELSIPEGSWALGTRMHATYMPRVLNSNVEIRIAGSSGRPQLIHERPSLHKGMRVILPVISKFKHKKQIWFVHFFIDLHQTSPWKGSLSENEQIQLPETVANILADHDRCIEWGTDWSICLCRR